MFNIYLSKVLAIVGGLRDEQERNIVSRSFTRQLTPGECAIVIRNHR